MAELRAFRLLPVPMHLDDPRWRRSWRQKPCVVFHTSEMQARSAAAHFFSTADRNPPWSLDEHPWSDAMLVLCQEHAATAEPPGLAVVTDLGGERIDPADYDAAPGAC